VDQPVRDGANDALKSVIGFMVFVVAFSLVQVQGQFRAAEELAQKEANAVHTLDRTLLRFGTSEALASRQKLFIYVQSIIDDEWKMLAGTDRSSKTDALQNEFTRSARLLESQTSRQQGASTEILRGLDDMYDLREARINAGEYGLSTLYWWTILALFVVVLILSFFTNASVDKTLAHCGMTCAVALLVALVMIYESPFSGDTSVQPTALNLAMKMSELK
jgi:hypothetical protein